MRAWLKMAHAGDLDAATPVLIPVDELAEADMQELPWKVALRADIVKPRNPGLHRKAFALLKIVWPHTNYPTIDALRAALTIGAGFIESTIEPYSGNVVWYPKSWAFDAMDDLEFRDLYNRLIDVALQIVPNSRRDDWEAAVDNIVRM